jgi:MoaA/NifB/PqqE/SkfB family radical SAM enzyme
MIAPLAATEYLTPPGQAHVAAPGGGRSPVAAARSPGRALDLAPMICFRVTRFCNAHCGFCLAPPDGGPHPSVSTLKGRIDWLLARSVKTIHFCGGEPTIHHGLPELIAYVLAQGGKSKLTTNGIAVADSVIPVLRAAKTQVKISLHGDQAHHDEIVGRAAFNETTATINRLLSAGVTVSVQTTIVAGRLDIVSWMIRFCVNNKVPRLSFLPFIPRGSGYSSRAKYELSPAERNELRNLIKQMRRELSSRLDIRLLDFNTRPIHVVEPDGRIILEGPTETCDTFLFQIPDVGASGHHNHLALPES